MSNETVATPPSSHPPADTPIPSARPQAPLRRVAIFMVICALLTGLLFLGLDYLLDAFTHETTDDAFIEASIVAISPQVSGRVAAVRVQDNQWVNQGDVLAEIDTRDYDTALTRRQAALQVSQNNRKSIEAGYEVMTAKVVSAEADARQSESEAAASKATADKADADLRRAESLFAQKVISSEEYDQFRTEAAAAAARAAADQAQVASDQSKVQEVHAQVEAVLAALDMNAAQIAQSEADRTAAELELSYTRIASPTNGFVTRKAVHAGEYVQIGQRLLAVVPTNVWVIANFKETQLDHIRPGLPVRLSVDAYPEEDFSGHVDSIQSGTGSRFSLLPPENAVGNYVKVVQRVPVKILIDSSPGHGKPLGPGMSVVPSVRFSEFTIPGALLACGAAVLSVLLTAGGWMMMAQRSSSRRRKGT